MVTSYLGPNKAYEWTVTAIDLAGHQRLSREKFRFTTGATTDGTALPGSCDEGFGVTLDADIWYNYTATCTGSVVVGKANVVAPPQS